MRRKRALLNMMAMITYQGAAMICSFVIQRMWISHYGSELVGIVVSITKFISFITLLEAGVGSIIAASLYKPLAEQDSKGISIIVKASNRFFRGIAFILIGYIIVLGVFLPRITDIPGLGNVYVFFLTASIGISSIIQYYFGMTHQLLLQADQKQYIPTALNILTVLANTLIVVILVISDADIIWIKLMSSVVYIVKPIFLYIYCRQTYHINKAVSYQIDPIKQKWSGIGHHISFIIHTSTDITLLTMLGQYSSITVYMVYAMIVGSLTSIIDCVSSGVQAAFGNVIALKEGEVLNRSFKVFEAIIHICVVTFFGTAAFTILPFMHIYTKGIADTQYILPVFAVLMVLQEALFCLRRPYLTVIHAAGHYKQTQLSAYAEAGINIVVSVLLIRRYGLAGIAFGTFVAMAFRLFYSVIYIGKQILLRKKIYFIRCILADLISIAIMTGAYLWLFSHQANEGYLEWALTALLTMLVLLTVTLGVYWLINREAVRLVREEIRTTVSVLWKGNSQGKGH